MTELTHQYAVLLPGDESRWAEATPEERARVYDVHRAFMAALAERGHVVTGGAELAPSATARTLVTGADGAHRVTEGPYAESVEQLTGFYLVRSDDLDDLLDTCRVLADGEGAIEVRACVGGAS